MASEQGTPPDRVPACKWTGGGDRVLILKCVGPDGRSHGNFLWPERGPVTPDRWSRADDCNSGGLFGWPWGLAVGHGKLPDYARDRWIVFAAHPDDVIDVEGLGGKVKAVPNPEAGRTPEVVYSGTWFGADELVRPGRLRWLLQAASAAPDASDLHFAGALARASVPKVGVATRRVHGVAATVNDFVTALASNMDGVAASSGNWGAALTEDHSGVAAATGYGGRGQSHGYGGVAVCTGSGGVALAGGRRGVAAVAGGSGTARAAGPGGIACATSVRSTVEASATGVAVCTADECWWRVVEGALFVQRWEGGHVALTADLVGARTGDRLRFYKGEIVERVPAGGGS